MSRLSRVKRLSELSDADARLSGYYKIVHKPKEVRTGMLVLLGLLLWIFAFVWMRTGGFRSPDTVHAVVTLENVQGLTVGDPVMIAGARVGRVKRVELVDVGEVRVILEIRKSVRPHRDARAAVRPLDVLGARFIDYRPGVAPEVLDDGAPILGFLRDPLQAGTEGIRTRGAELAFAVQDLASDELREELRATVAAVAAARAALAETDVGPIAAEATDALGSAQRASERLRALLRDSAWARSGAHVVAAKAEAAEMADGLGRAIDALGRMAARADSGHGTLGRLKTDSVLRANVEAMRRMVRGLTR